MNAPFAITFEQSDLLTRLARMDEATLDAIDFGVIGFDRDCVVRHYNLFESRAAGLHKERVIGRHLFTEIAQCMNNYLVAQKYVDAQAASGGLDETLDFVLTWRMRPTPVKLRLLASPEMAMQFLVLKHLSLSQGRPG
jgi:photoactive yellow protein